MLFEMFETTRALHRHPAELSERVRRAVGRVMTAVTELQNSSVEEWENCQPGLYDTVTKQHSLPS